MHYTFAMFVAFHIDFMKILVEYFLMYHILRKVHKEFRNINNSLLYMDISNSKIILQNVIKCINYHNEMCNLANKLNQIFMFNNFSTLLNGFISIIMCGHYISYTIRFLNIFAEGSSSLVGCVLFSMGITLMLQEWMFIKNEVCKP